MACNSATTGRGTVCSCYNGPGAGSILGPGPRLLGLATDAVNRLRRGHDVITTEAWVDSGLVCAMWSYLSQDRRGHRVTSVNGEWKPGKNKQLSQNSRITVQAIIRADGLITLLTRVTAITVPTWTTAELQSWRSILSRRLP